TTIFQAYKGREKAYDGAEKEVAKLNEVQGSFADGADQFVNVLENIHAAKRKVEKLYVYSHLKNDQDTGNNTYQAMNNRAMTLVTSAAAASSWFDPELLTLPEEKIEKYFEDNKDLELYRHAIQNITTNRDHVLSAEMEGLLAEAGDVLDGSQQTFAILNNADIEFPTVTNEDGEEVQLSHGLYGQLLESKNRDVR